MSRDRKRDITMSEDPALIAARCFVANLPTERITVPEVQEKFSPFGHVLGVALLKGFGFVQYGTEEDCKKACDKLAGTYFKGCRIDVKPASYNRKRRADESPPRSSDSRSHLNNSAESDGITADDIFPVPKRKDVGYDRPFDAAIIVSDKTVRSYAENIERKLIEINLTIDIIFLINPDGLDRAIDDMIRRGLLYIIVLKPHHEVHKAMTLYILHGKPQELRNIPTEDAIPLLARTFGLYVSSLRIGSEQPSMGFLLNLLADAKHLSADELTRIIVHLTDRRDRLLEGQGLKPPVETAEANGLDKDHSKPVDANADTGTSAARDITPEKSPAEPSAAATRNQTAQLQQRIMSILGGSSGNSPLNTKLLSEANASVSKSKGGAGSESSTSSIGSVSDILTSKKTTSKQTEEATPSVRVSESATAAQSTASILSSAAGLSGLPLSNDLKKALDQLLKKNQKQQPLTGSASSSTPKTPSKSTAASTAPHPVATISDDEPDYYSIPQLVSQATTAVSQPSSAAQITSSHHQLQQQQHQQQAGHHAQQPLHVPVTGSTAYNPAMGAGQPTPPGMSSQHAASYGQQRGSLLHQPPQMYQQQAQMSRNHMAGMGGVPPPPGTQPGQYQQYGYGVQQPHMGMDHSGYRH